MRFREYPTSGTSALAPDIRAAAAESNGFVIELGVHAGFGSTMFIQDGLWDHPDALHVGVDWSDIIEDQYRPTVPWWHLVMGDTRLAETVAKVRVITPRMAGVIYIDTDHNYDQMKAELTTWGTMADDNTVWLFHDVYMFGPPNVTMVKAITEYATMHGWIYEDVRTDSHGLGRMRK